MVTKPRPDFLTPAGRSGLREWGGFLGEERDPSLQGARGRAVFREMRNTATLGAGLRAIEMLIRKVPWHFEPFDKGRAAAEAADFVTAAANDLVNSFEDFIAEHLNFLSDGFQLYEMEYKERHGPQNDLLADVENQQMQRAPATPPSSKYDDGRIGWKQFGVRPPDSLLNWVFNDQGDVLGMWQQPPPHYDLRFVPMGKAMNFRTTSYKNNPEGESLFRSCVWEWRAARKLQRIEGIGAERDLAGLPVAKVPPELLMAGLNAADANTLAQIKTMLKNIRNDEQASIIWPLAYDDEGNEVYKLELLTSGGARQFDTDALISRYEQRMLMSMLMDFLLIGHGGVGAKALVDSRMELVAMAITGWLAMSSNTFDSRATPQLLVLNGIDARLAPSLTFGKVENVSLEELGNYIEKIAAAGALTPGNQELEKHLLEAADAPTEHIPKPQVAAAPPPMPLPVPVRERPPQPTATEGQPGRTIAASEWPDWITDAMATALERRPADIPPPEWRRTVLRRAGLEASKYVEAAA